MFLRGNVAGPQALGAVPALFWLLSLGSEMLSALQDGLSGWTCIGKWDREEALLGELEHSLQSKPHMCN